MRSGGFRYQGLLLWPFQKPVGSHSIEQSLVHFMSRLGEKEADLERSTFSQSVSGLVGLDVCYHLLGMCEPAKDMDVAADFPV